MFLVTESSPRGLVRGRLLYAIDHEHFKRRVGGLQFQSELVVQGGGNRDGVGVRRRSQIIAADRTLVHGGTIWSHRRHVERWGGCSLAKTPRLTPSASVIGSIQYL